MAWGVSRWTDGELMDLAVKIVLGAAENLPADFAADRGRLYFGPDWDLKAIQADLPWVVAQVRAQFGWIDQRVATGRRFLLGDAPGLPDALAYYLVWFLRGRWQEGPTFLSQFPALEAWEARVAALGHGSPEDLSADAALEIARAAEPAVSESGDPDDPQGLKPGMAVEVVPAGYGGDPAVAGTLRFADRESVAILREDERVGRVCVHFPRVGYRVTVG
jgi:glutathione S-transferase